MEMEETRALGARWWMFVVRGVVAVLFGVLAIAMPKISLLALVVLYGAFAMVDGVFSLVTAARRGRAGERCGWFLFEGLVGIGAAIVAFSWPGITAVVLLALIAAWAILTGISAVAAAIRMRKHVKGEWMLAVSGVLSIVFGALLLVDPSVGALAVVWMIGAYAIAFGILLIGLGIRLFRHRTVGEPRMPSSGVPTPA
jgi:uncharacterized membrane protein HdeD (DUF308 family)